jgi:LacI family repressor for deo operon, udp, cdd, tsx, nupC, and nupG
MIMAITQKELAKILGIAQMTVSRCLRGAPNVSVRTHEAVLAAARQYGYSLDNQFAASALQHRRSGRPHATNVICAIIREIPGEFTGFHQRLLDGVCDGAAQFGSEVIVAPRMEEDYPRVVRRKQVDGVVHLLSDSVLQDGISDCPVPWVSILFDVSGADVVTVDNRAAMRDLGRHLARLGHRRFAFIGPDTVLGRQRLAGVRQAAAEFGGTLPDDCVVFCSHTVAFEQGGVLAASLAERAAALPSRDRFTALAAYNDIMAAAAIRGLTAKGVRVPQDVSVVGCDGTVPHNPPLTTVALPLEALGVEAARLIAWRLEHLDAPRRKRVLRTTLVDGQTTQRVLMSPRG